MRHLPLTVLLLLVSLIAGATAQFGERIVVDGQEKELFNLLLERHPSFETLDRRLNEKTSTALWRKYIGHWKLQNDSLFLDSIMTPSTGGGFVSVKIDDLFAENKTPSGYFADWVTDTLDVQWGKTIRYIHMGWESSLENRDFYVVTNGIARHLRNEKNRIVNEGISDSDWIKINTISVDSFPDMPERIVVRCSVSKFKEDGNPEEYSFTIVRPVNLSDEAKAMLEKEVRRFLKENKVLSVYYINGKYQSDVLSYPIKLKKK